MLRVNELNVTYRETGAKAVEQVSFELQKGEVLGILGMLAVLFLALPSRTASADGMYAPCTGTSVANTADQQAALVFGSDWTRLV
ncbi:MAG: hypothetical protein KKD13_01670, partial [Candidatus Margulisbacteria bacterium]|nr:hypothetical protein [Candidatus Margulisiibacteriota bacterium]